MPCPRLLPCAVFGEMQGSMGLRLIGLCAWAFQGSPMRGRTGNRRALRRQGCAETSTLFGETSPLPP